MINKIITTMVNRPLDEPHMMCSIFGRRFETLGLGDEGVGERSFGSQPMDSYQFPVDTYGLLPAVFVLFSWFQKHFSPPTCQTQWHTIARYNDKYRSRSYCVIELQKREIRSHQTYHFKVYVKKRSPPLCLPAVVKAQDSQAGQPDLIPKACVN